MRLPMPREPECSITHTRSPSSRQTSMKWLPVPSVPRCSSAVPWPIFGCFSTIAFRPCSGERHSRCSRVVQVSAPRPARRCQAPWSRVDPAAAGPAVRHRRLDRGAQRRQRLSGSWSRGQRRPHRHHAAADVDADRGRHDRPLTRNDAADGGAQAPVHVRHDGDVMMHERQARDVLQLAARLRLDRHARRPRLDRPLRLHAHRTRS